MSKSRFFLIVFTAVFSLLVVFSIAVLSLNAQPSNDPSTADGKWYQVCCGPSCTGGDICYGDGSYTCCK